MNEKHTEMFYFPFKFSNVSNKKRYVEPNHCREATPVWVVFVLHKFISFCFYLVYIYVRHLYPPISRRHVQGPTAPIS